MIQFKYRAKNEKLKRKLKTFKLQFVIKNYGY